MDDTKTPTLTPPETPIPTEEPSLTPPGAPAEPQPEPAAEQPAEGEEAEQEPTAPWANVASDDIDGLFEVEDVKAHHERGVQEAHDTAYQELQGHMQPLLQGNKQALDRIGAASETILTTLNRAVEDQVLDKRTVEDLLRTNRDVFAALNKTYQTTGFWEGVRQYVNGVANAADDPNIATTFLPRVERMESGVPDPTLIADLVKKVSNKARQEGEGIGYKKGLKEGKTAQAAQTKAQTDKNEGPNLAPTKPGGSGGGYRTKAEARTLHAQNKISNEEMRRVKADPNIPEM